jgi:hypothetical protein
MMTDCASFAGLLGRARGPFRVGIDGGGDQPILNFGFADIVAATRSYAVLELKSPDNAVADEKAVAQPPVSLVPQLPEPTIAVADLRNALNCRRHKPGFRDTKPSQVVSAYSSSHCAICSPYVTLSNPTSGMRQSPVFVVETVDSSHPDEYFFSPQISIARAPA